MSKLIDLTGQKFGKLTVLYRSDDYISKNGRHRTQWHCKCDCGNECDVISWDLRNKRKDCDRCNSDITNKKYNHLTAIKRGDDYISPKGVHAERWWFKCDCGNQKLIVKSQVVNGRTKSCGCLIKETSSKLNKKENIYDLSGEYGIGWTWAGEEFWFDKEDYDLIKNYCWWLDSRGYVVTEMSTEDSKSIVALARIIMFPPPNTCVVYKNGFESRLDNRKENLEIVKGASPSKEYLESTNKYGCVGVTERKGRNKKWRVTIKVNGKLIDLGSYYTFEEAVEARKKGEKMYGR